MRWLCQIECSIGWTETQVVVRAGEMKQAKENMGKINKVKLGMDETDP